MYAEPARHHFNQSTHGEPLHQHSPHQNPSDEIEHSADGILHAFHQPGVMPTVERFHQRESAPAPLRLCECSKGGDVEDAVFRLSARILPVMDECVEEHVCVCGCNIRVILCLLH